jgi:hypothetical protein
VCRIGYTTRLLELPSNIASAKDSEIKDIGYKGRGSELANAANSYADP